MEEHKNKDSLEEKRKELDEAMKKAPKRGILFLMRKRRQFASIPNKLCAPCRTLLRLNSMRPENDYCVECQSMMRRVLGK